MLFVATTDGQRFMAGLERGGTSRRTLSCVPDAKHAVKGGDSRLRGCLRIAVVCARTLSQTERERER